MFRPTLQLQLAEIFITPKTRWMFQAKEQFTNFLQCVSYDTIKYPESQWCLKKSVDRSTSVGHLLGNFDFNVFN